MLKKILLSLVVLGTLAAGPVLAANSGCCPDKPCCAEGSGCC